MRTTAGRPIDLNGGSLVRPPDPAAAATTVGTQLATFCAVSAGAATLRSSDGTRTWSLTVDVSPN